MALPKQDVSGTWASMAKRAVLYLRVSTGGQTVENQRRELLQVAERCGWQVVAELADEGVSGAKGRDRRPGLAALHKMVARREVDLVAAWSVDRLGRSLRDLVELLGDLQAKGVDLFLAKEGVDTGTPSGRALFAMAGVFAEFERGMIRERVLAGQARARAQGRRIGRPPVTPATEEKIRKLRAQGLGVQKIRKELGIGAGVVQRVLAAAA